ncbi:hypothetical protein F3Y22_tig00112530pilonHSYRG00262 [Hibiscus syriacus]|uniref:Uncharacterized protein n=1 Tax=Hibiscus syriacus TaxID=106335 RepID=A0A6A2Y1Y2_HIBSY|nr:hypothetical protein F3Y22_tig00112530pilonHSYRG00262 [Hibiscus syriacus]
MRRFTRFVSRSGSREEADFAIATVTAQSLQGRPHKLPGLGSKAYGGQHQTQSSRLQRVGRRRSRRPSGLHHHSHFMWFPECINRIPITENTPMYRRIHLGSICHHRLIVGALSPFSVQKLCLAWTKAVSLR